MDTVIVAGGSGYIGTAVTEQLIKLGIRVFDLDLVKPKFTHELLDYYQVNLTDQLNLYEIKSLLKDATVLGVMHFAAWKGLPESLDIPFEYYHNNLVSLLNVLQLANFVRAKTFIFSSSAGVYSDGIEGKTSENDSTEPSSPYGYTKLVGERIVRDCCNQFSIKGYSLRYFNPVGATEYSYDDSTSLFGVIFNCAKNGTKLTIFGDDWDSHDGTCIRDFIDIRDLANAHIHFINNPKNILNYNVINIGTGVETTVLDVAKAAEKLIPGFQYEFGPRREGDGIGGYADTHRLSQYGFSTQYTVEDSIQSILNKVNELKSNGLK